MSGEEESAAMYNTAETTAAEIGNVDVKENMMEVDNEETQEQDMDKKLRFEIARKR
jgi:hypothetical protein